VFQNLKLTGEAEMPELSVDDIKKVLPYAEVYKIYKNKFYAKIPKEYWQDSAKKLKEAGFSLLVAVTGIDRQTHMEVNFICRRPEANGLIIVGSQIDRRDPRIPTLVNIWLVLIFMREKPLICLVSTLKAILILEEYSFQKIGLVIR